jgi:hypothetical protein
LILDEISSVAENILEHITKLSYNSESTRSSIAVDIYPHHDSTSQFLQQTLQHEHGSGFAPLFQFEIMAGFYSIPSYQQFKDLFPPLGAQ